MEFRQKRLEVIQVMQGAIQKNDIKAIFGDGPCSYICTYIIYGTKSWGIGRRLSTVVRNRKDVWRLIEANDCVPIARQFKRHIPIPAADFQHSLRWGVESSP